MAAKITTAGATALSCAPSIYILIVLCGRSGRVWGGSGAQERVSNVDFLVVVDKKDLVEEIPQLSLLFTLATEGSTSNWN